jgi:hypothetical protein
MGHCTIFHGMSTTTRRQHKSSTSVSGREVRSRLKKARARNLELKLAGKLMSPTKQWSKDSMKSLKSALSGQKVATE